MALVLHNRTSTGSGHTFELPKSVSRTTLVAVAKTLVASWIGLNVMTWAPTVGARGECDCPLCHPLTFRSK